MSKKIEKTRHYNLYYIFKEDKERNQLPKSNALILLNNVIKALQKNKKVEIKGKK